MRFGLNSDLGFSDEDRQENIRRVAEVAKFWLKREQGCLYKKARQGTIKSNPLSTGYGFGLMNQPLTPLHETLKSSEKICH
uniref:APS kinase domain-containing protein n=1 Tax=Daphnia galeata TaxID=27404 RepID=A0A8J2WCZ7_9CRUS|nr:unnamed protein product [Daphnia galeata]